MKIKIYGKWVENLSSLENPYNASGQPKRSLDTQTHTGQQITQRLAKYRSAGVGKQAKYLVVVTDKNYKNSLIGSGEVIQRFVRDCLEDEKLMCRKNGGKL